MGTRGTTGYSVNLSEFGPEYDDSVEDKLLRKMNAYYEMKDINGAKPSLFVDGDNLSFSATAPNKSRIADLIERYEMEPGKPVKPTGEDFVPLEPTDINIFMLTERAIPAFETAYQFTDEDNLILAGCGGNCGHFAISMNKMIGNVGRYVILDCNGDYFHVALEVDTDKGTRIYDWKGVVTKEEMKKEYLETDHERKQSQIKRLPANEDSDYEIIYGTNMGFRVTPDGMLKVFLKAKQEVDYLNRKEHGN